MLVAAWDGGSNDGIINDGRKGSTIHDGSTGDNKDGDSNIGRWW